MQANEIRARFLAYFHAQGHTIVASSPLVPANDPTLLFTNSGMVQFKDVFLGRERRPYVRAVSAQRCLRVGGKHNDLENVGYTARHHTFFEMLGNFSFGDYFKRDAIRFAWELLTTVYRLPPERLWTTVYHSDDEAYELWTGMIGVPKERCVRIGDKPGGQPYQSDNFWQMADTGPCGPCSEIFYDHGPGVPGGPPGTPEAEGDRYIEIWNLVFMQFNRDEDGVLHPLPRPSVDTGMGLERIAAVLQGKHSNFETDLLQSLVRAAARETGVGDLRDPSLNVIADHIRASAFLIVDGVMPGNEGRGYVLRRIVRRAVRHGYTLGRREPFFYRLVADLVRTMGAAYPELDAAKERVARVLQQEEERFAETIGHGMQLLESALAGGATRLDGETVFRLYDTYGFPVDLTADVCRERGVALDLAGFEAAMQEQRARARAASRFAASAGLDYAGGRSEFCGYDSLALVARVVALYREGVAVGELAAGESGVVVLDRTPFYAESGGQVGDQGALLGPAGTFAVADTQKIHADVHGHHGVQETGRLRVGEEVRAQVNAHARGRAMRNHSATHLMHAALRRVLGTHVQQKGSLVEANRTRFDFSHPAAMTREEMRAVEAFVNDAIRSDLDVSVRHMRFDEALRAGALAFFGDKYGEEVRVISMGDVSTELCGGTHVRRTGEIGFFKVVSETGIAAGVRRIEAVAGEGALAWAQEQEALLQEAAAALRAPPAALREKIAQLQERTRELERELARMQSRLVANRGEDLAGRAQAVKGARVLAAEVEIADARALREAVDRLKEKLGSAAIVLGAVHDGRVALVAGVTADLTARVKAADLVNFVAQQVGGRGGGRADMAQAGGTDPARLAQALASVRDWVAARL